MNLATEQGFSEAMKWTRAQLHELADGGVWIIPRSMSAVRVTSHRKLEAEMIGMKREPGVVGMMRALGWRLTDMDKQVQR
jgi:hypothetical protein